MKAILCVIPCMLNAQHVWLWFFRCWFASDGHVSSVTSLIWGMKMYCRHADTKGWSVLSDSYAAVLPRTSRSDVLVFLLWICSLTFQMWFALRRQTDQVFFFRSPNAQKAIGTTSAPVGPRTAMCGPMAVVSPMAFARCGWDFHCTTIMKVSFFTKWSCRLFSSQGSDV